MSSDLKNRIHNSSNPAQGRFRRTLCVCSAGLLRSPTLAWILSNPPYNRNTRAAGSVPNYALVPVDEVLLRWAQEIVFVNSQNHKDVANAFTLGAIDAEITVLNVPDRFEFRNPNLVKAIQSELHRAGFPYFEMGELNGV